MATHGTPRLSDALGWGAGGGDGGDAVSVDGDLVSAVVEVVMTSRTQQGHV